MISRFRIRHLLAVTSAVAVVLGVYSRSPYIAVLVCPLVLGGAVGGWVDDTWRAVRTGALAGFCWPAAVLLFVGPAMLYRMLSGPETAWPTLAFFAFLSVIGGYLGGLLEVEANRAEDESSCR